MTERQWFTVGMFALTGAMLAMAWDNPQLWEVKLFELVLQAIVITGLLNMAGAFHFAANQNNEQATENTGKAFDAIRAAAAATPVSDAATGKPDDPVHMVEEGK